MEGVDITFKNVITKDGKLADITVKDCLVGPTGSATSLRPQIIIHLPKKFKGEVKSGWVDYGGDQYHVTNQTSSGTTAPLITSNTPTRWDRYCIAEIIA